MKVRDSANSLFFQRLLMCANKCFSVTASALLDRVIKKKKAGES